jgi:hypothetical protein
VLRRVARLRAAHGRAVYYLGLRFRGLALVAIDTQAPAPDVVEVVDWAPEPGEIGTQGC